MPNRILKESICVSDQINQLSWFEEILFYRLMVNVDDYGRYDGRPAIIRSRLFPLKDVRDKQIEDALGALSSVELVEVYSVDGKPFVRLTGWDKHQTIRAKKSKYPAPDSGCENMKSFASKCVQMFPYSRFENRESNSLFEMRKIARSRKRHPRRQQSLCR